MDDYDESIIDEKYNLGGHQAAYGYCQKMGPEPHHIFSTMKTLKEDSLHKQEAKLSTLFIPIREGNKNEQGERKEGGWKSLRTKRQLLNIWNEAGEGERS